MTSPPAVDTLAGKFGHTQHESAGTDVMAISCNSDLGCVVTALGGVRGAYSTYFTKSKSVHTLEGLALPRATTESLRRDRPGCALAGSRRLHSTLAAAPVLFAHAVVTGIRNK